MLSRDTHNFIVVNQQNYLREFLKEYEQRSCVGSTNMHVIIYFIVTKEMII